MTVNASVWTGGNPEGFLIHVIGAIEYIERSKLFESRVSYKTQVDKYNKDAKEIREYLADLNNKLKKARERANELTTALSTITGTTDTPTIPDDLSAKNPEAHG